MKIFKSILKLKCLLLLYVFVGEALAEVDKVYHPYVEADTYEIESRLISLLDSELSANLSIYRLGFGKDLLDNLFVEFYLIGAQDTSKNIDIEAFEVESLYQFTEQGEYWLDFAMLFEIEKELDSKEWEGNIGFIFEKEFGRWSATLNLQNRYLYEDDQQHDWVSSQAFQIRYRNSQLFEPGFEIYADNQDVFIGPVMLGVVKLERNKLNWEIGIVTEISHSSNDTILRAVVEYEF